MTFLKLLFISACCHFAGTAALAAVMSWPKPDEVLGSILFSPLMAVAGWPMAILILLLVLLMWGAYQQGLIGRRILFVVTGTMIGAVFGLLFAGGDIAIQSEPWGLAFFVGSCLAGTLANTMIMILFRAPNNAAAPTGVPPELHTDSGGPEKPPSVS